VQEEFYATRITIEESELSEKTPEQVMELVRYKFETALLLLDSYREFPPPLKNPLTGEETEVADNV
jgi:hypothetical protein